MKRSMILLVALGLAGPPIAASSYYISPDVPTDRGGITWLPWQIVRVDGTTYSLAAALPPPTPIAGVHRMCQGDWLIALEAPSDLGGTTYEARDVVRYDAAAGGYLLYFCGGPVGVPDGIGIDAVFLDADENSDLILSFDAPTTLTATTYEPSDLVRFTPTAPGCGGWSVVGAYFDASTTTPPIPLASNVTGADQVSAGVLLTLDVPTTLSATTYLPGTIVIANAAGFTTWASDALWPVSGRADAFGLLADPGSVPPTMRVFKSSLTPGDLRLSWNASGSVGAEDYGIYEGSLTAGFYNHGAIDCTDDLHDLQEEITPAASQRYYLVVPWNGSTEGSYGTDSASVQRPQGSSPCAAAQALGCP